MSTRNKIGLRKERAEIISLMKTTSDYKKQVIEFEGRLRREYEENRIDKEEYFRRLNEELQGRTLKQWLRYYEQCINTYNTRIVEIDREIKELEKTKNLVPILTILAFVALLGLSYYFIQPAITGFVVQEDSVTFDRNLDCDKCGQHKAPPSSGINMTITVSFSGTAENVSLIDYYPSTWEIIDNAGGLIENYNESHNKIIWIIESATDIVSKSYIVRGPGLTSPPTKYDFMTEFNNKLSDPWFVIISDVRELASITLTSPTGGAEVVIGGTFTYTCASDWGGGSGTGTSGTGNWTYCAGAGCTPRTRLTTGTTDLTGTDSDGLYSCSGTGCSDTSHSQTVTGNVGGTYRLQCNMADQTPDHFSSAIVTISVTDKPPGWSSPTVDDSTPDITQNVTHTVTWNEDGGLNTIILEVNGTGAGCDTWANVSSTVLSGTSQVVNLGWTIPSACGGKWISWKQYANDTSGQWNVTSGQNYTVNEADITPPVASFGTDPVNAFNGTSSTMTFDLKCSDNVAVNTLALYLNTTSTWEINKTNTTVLNDYFWNVTVTNIPEGLWQWAAWCNDTFITSNSDFTDTNRTFTVDLNPPTIQYETPTAANDSFSGKTNIEINVSATDAIALKNITIYLYNSSYGLVSSVTSTTSPLYNDFTGLSGGRYYFNATAFDTAGQSSVTNTRTLRIYGASAEPGGPGPSNDLSTQRCNQENVVTTHTYPDVCDGSYPAACGAGGDLVGCNDGQSELASYDTDTYGGINITNYNSAITNCNEIVSVHLCYEIWASDSTGDCVLAVDADGGASYTNITTDCPGQTANPGVTCTEITTLESWTCSSFFGASGTRALGRNAVDRPANGPAQTLTTDVLFFNVTYSLAGGGGNTAPDNVVPIIMPAVPDVNDDLNGSAYVTDPESDSMTVEFVWWNNTRVHFRTNITGVASGTNISYTLLNNATNVFTEGENWTVSFRANDGQESNAWANASKVIAAAANNVPEILYVENISTQSISENNFSNVTISFRVNDADGVSSIDFNRAKLNLTKASYERSPVYNYSSSTSGGCFDSGDINSTTANISCSVHIWYFDPAGQYNISVSYVDENNAFVQNVTHNFTLSSTIAILVSPNNLTFGSSIFGGQDNVTINNGPIEINNTGNVPITSGNIRITARNMIGEFTKTQYIPAVNFSAEAVNRTTSDANAGCRNGNNATAFVNNTATGITNTVLAIGNHSINNGTAGIEHLFVCLYDVPLGLNAQAYSTLELGAWTLDVV